jgi:primary-amine oxidase
LHQIHYHDPDKDFERRPIGWRFSVPEMVVPYGNPFDPSWRKCAYDAGEDGLGANANSLSLGCDCLGLIHYFDAYLVTGTGGVEKI